MIELNFQSYKNEKNFLKEKETYICNYENTEAN